MHLDKQKRGGGRWIETALRQIPFPFTLFSCFPPSATFPSSSHCRYTFFFTNYFHFSLYSVFLPKKYIDYSLCALCGLSPAVSGNCQRYLIHFLWVVWSVLPMSSHMQLSMWEKNNKWINSSVTSSRNKHTHPADPNRYKIKAMINRHKKCFRWLPFCCFQVSNKGICNQI